jgi:hypothetical protein
MPPNCHFDSLNLVGVQAQDPGQLDEIGPCLIYQAI